MLKVGATDVFERVYTQKFRDLMGNFGEFVLYERDRGARDIGIHLTRRQSDGGNILSSSLCFFQLKGIMSSTLTASAYSSKPDVDIKLSVRHLQYWYLQPVPTFLALFAEAVDTFLVLNLKKYVTDRWGTSIFSLDQDTVKVSVPRTSILDRVAINHILNEGDVTAWATALRTDSETAALCVFEHGLIWHLGTSADRGVHHRLCYRDWQSKSRKELYFQESPIVSESWTYLRTHWQYLLRSDRIPDMYPYLEFADEESNFEDEDDGETDEVTEGGDDAGKIYETKPTLTDAEDEPADTDGMDDDDDSSDDDTCWLYDDDDDTPMLRFPNGQVFRSDGSWYAGEYHQYHIKIRLNSHGRRLFELVKLLVSVGFVEIQAGAHEFVSIAPWQRRSV